MEALFKNKNLPNEPHVLCAMVTGHSVERIPMAIERINMFLKQTYENCSLLIINDGPLLNVWHDRVYEIKLPKIHDLGTLRNIILDLSHDSWICQWDDDDVYPIDKVERQVYELIDSGKDACVYRNQIIYSIPSNCARYYTSYDWYGIEGTILHRPTVYRYPISSKGEDTVFIEKFKNNLHVINNLPEENIKLYHGANVWDEFKVMQQLYDKKNFWKISDFHKRILSETLRNLDINYVRPTSRPMHIDEEESIIL